MLNRVTCIAAILTCAFVPSAYAADIVASENTPMTTAPSFSWAGFYVGGQVGESWSNGSFEREVEARKRDFPEEWVVMPSLITEFTSKSINGGKFISGGYGGYNWQLPNNIVFGIDADIALTNNTRKSNETAPFGESRIDGYNYKIEQNWSATVRGRIGYSYNRILPYIAGGVAVTDIKYSQRYFGDVRHIDFDDRDSKTRTITGWSIGAGVEYAMTDHFIIRTEYRHIDYGDRDFVVDYRDRHMELKANDFRFGVAHKF